MQKGCHEWIEKMDTSEDIETAQEISESLSTLNCFINKVPSYLKNIFGNKCTERDKKLIQSKTEDMLITKKEDARNVNAYRSNHSRSTRLFRN